MRLAIPWHLLGIFILLGACMTWSLEGAEPVRITVYQEVLNRVDDRLFGQFMERASWGEAGYDAARDPKRPRHLDPQVVEKMRWMNIPVIRFPAGSDLKRIDWRDMIDNVPDREGGRPVFVDNKHGRLTNEFGIDEFCGLCEELGAEPLLPVRFYEALAKKKSPVAAAGEAAGLVAYCNLEVGADLPDGMPDWPRIRAGNGRREPWGVKYFQIGNETWTYYRKIRDEIGLGDGATSEEVAGWYLECLHAYLEAIHEVDPTVEIIVDGVTGLGEDVDRRILTDEKVREHAHYASLHLYQPWGIRIVERDGKAVSIGELSAEDIWKVWVTVPGVDSETGFSSLAGRQHWQKVADLGWAIAATEWNWNGWWRLPKGSPKPALNSKLAQGIGAAGMLHAFMRRGEDVRLGCQSMLVGRRWGITAIRVDPDGDEPPHLYPTGMVTGFYSNYHGNQRLRVETAGMPTYEQPYRMQGIRPQAGAAYLDVVATRGHERLFLHVINRHFSAPQSMVVDVSPAGIEAGRALQHTLTGRLRNKPTPAWPSLEVARIETTELDVEPTRVAATLPARSVAILEITIR